MNGLKRLSGAKKVDLATFKRPVGTFVVTFDKAPNLGSSDLSKVITSRFKMKTLSYRITVDVSKKGKFWMANGLKLTNPKKGTDFLATVKKHVEAGKKTLVLSGELVEAKKGENSLTLSAVTVAKKKEKKS